MRLADLIGLLDNNHSASLGPDTPQPSSVSCRDVAPARPKKFITDGTKPDLGNGALLEPQAK
jgi:hypothetical protein